MLDWFLGVLGSALFLLPAVVSGKIALWKSMETKEERILWYLGLLVSIVLTAVTISVGYFWPLEGAWHYVLGYVLIFVFAISSTGLVCGILRLVFQGSFAQYIFFMIYLGLGNVLASQFFICHNFDVLSIIWEMN